MNLSFLNLSIIEEKLLSKLIEYQELNVKKLVGLVNHDKKVVYENLAKLVKKGLIKETIEKNVKIYGFSGSKSFQAILDKEKEEILKKENSMKETIKLMKKKKEFTESKGWLYSGKQGVRTFFNQLLEAKEYLVIGAPKESAQIMGETFWHNFHRKQEEKKIKAKIIFNKSLQSWKMDNPLLKVRYLKEIEPLTETIIFEDTMGIIIWTEEPTVMVIKSKEATRSYRDFFNLLWKQAK
jgi:sugar-specific transcriptional regulator TrmB